MTNATSSSTEDVKPARLPIELRSRVANRVVFVAVTVVVALILVARSLSAKGWYDEHMYVGAGVLGLGADVYEDFAFLQTPYFPSLLSSLFALTGTTWYWLTARATVLVFAAGCFGCTWVLVKRTSGSSAFSTIVSASLTLSSPFLFSASRALNVIPSLAFTLASLASLLASEEFDSRRLTGKARLVLPGLLLGLAVGTRATSAVFLLPAGILLVEHQKSAARLGLFLAGFLVACVPMALIASRAPENFLFFNLQFHTLNTEWRSLSGYSRAMSIPGKFSYLFRVLFSQPENATLAVLPLTAGIVHFLSRCRHEHRANSRIATAAVCAAAAAIIGILGPTPTWEYYLVLLLPSSALWLGFVYSDIHHRAKAALTSLALLCLIAAAINGSKGLRPALAASPDEWVPIKAHRMAQRVARHLPGGSGPVATLTPLYAMEAGLPVYPQLATGPFMFRVSDLLTDEQQHRFIGISSQNLQYLLASQPPRAFILGGEARQYEGLLENLAEASGYARMQVDSGLKVLVRPAVFNDSGSPIQ